MTSRALRVLLLALSVTLVLHASPAAAQPPEAFGTRAQGMAGAFTAVADDASATWWNPAGLAAGAFFNSIVEIGSDQQPSTDAVPASRIGSRSVSTAYPALGVSYYRLHISEIASTAAIAAGDAGRQDQGTADVRLRSLVLNQFGATFGQSIGNHFVVATTLKLLHGSLGTDVRPTASLDDADALEGSGETSIGIDGGAIARFGPAALGLMVRNLTESTFGSGTAAMTLTRQVRAGFALSSVSRCSTCGGVTLAVDADLRSFPTVLGDERRAAVGLEAWTPQRSFGARGGVSASTLGGDRRPALSGGMSAAVKKGTFIDFAVTRGSDQSRNSWDAGIRVTF